MLISYGNKNAAQKASDWGKMKWCEGAENMSAVMEGEIKDQKERGKMKQGNKTVDRLREWRDGTDPGGGILPAGLWDRNVSITLYSNSFNREYLTFEDQAKYMKEHL